MEQKGILILATGYPLYGRYAYNLLMTIKVMEPDMPVALAHDEAAISHLLPEQSGRFDYLIPVEHKSFGGKLGLDLITPFKQTMVLDADMAWMPKHIPSTLFANIGDAEFTAISEGKMDLATGEQDFSGKYFLWADLEEIISVHKLAAGTMYQYRSEMMYFTDSPKIKKMFARARKVYAQPRLKSIKLFGLKVPDELALNIAAAQSDVHPHRYKWSPSYWPKLHGEAVNSFEELYNSYYLFSAGSHIATPATKRIYDRIVGAAAYNLGNLTWFPLQNKAQAIPDRLKF